MPEDTSLSVTELEKELQQERELRTAAEAQARKWKSELVNLENEMAKAVKLRERLDRYRYKLSKARKQKRIYAIICVAMVLLASLFLLDRFRQAKQIETMKQDIQKKVAPKRTLPGIITQEAMERDAARQWHDEGDE